MMINKYKLKDYLQDELEPYKSTFKMTSFDKENQEYLCHDESVDHVYDFDAYVKYQSNDKKIPASPDAICIGEKQLYFVEFKNERVTDIDKKQLDKKFIQGTDILKEMLESFMPRDCQYSFCVVHKPQQQARYFNPTYIQERTLQSRLDELNKQRGEFYDKIFVNSIDFYQKEFTQLKCKREDEK